MRKTIIALLLTAIIGGKAHAANGDKYFGIAPGIMYERGMEITAGMEWETRNHKAWEFFGNYYLKWEECGNCGHVCPETFWRSYNTWALGAAYKPCVLRRRNTVGRLRLGLSAGSDRNEMIGGVHAGYEHNYRLKSGLIIYWQAKTDLMINCRDLFRTGIAIGIKLPIG